MVMKDGILKITIRDADNNGFFQPYFQNFFNYDPSHYRVVEIRLRNPANHPAKPNCCALGRALGIQYRGTRPVDSRNSRRFLSRWG